MTQPKLKSLPTTLSRDQYAALAEVSVMTKGAKPSACVARNAKHLSGTKFIEARRDGRFVLTEKGAQALFVNGCIAGLTAIRNVAEKRTPSETGTASASVLPMPTLPPDVAAFLHRKGYVVSDAETGAMTLTDKGRECLADISAFG